VRENLALLKTAVEQHKAIVAMHQAAARCLASGKDEKACHAELAKTCKGLAIGRLSDEAQALKSIIRGFVPWETLVKVSR
jgi:hypothetical protein